MTPRRILGVLALIFAASSFLKPEWHLLGVAVILLAVILLAVAEIVSGPAS